MTPDLARAALTFLSRCDLKGSEAPTLMAVAQALEDISMERVKIFPVTPSAVPAAEEG